MMPIWPLHIEFLARASPNSVADWRLVGARNAFVMVVVLLGGDWIEAGRAGLSLLRDAGRMAERPMGR
jgi:hypothetical protein